MAKLPFPANVPHQPIDSTTHLHMSDVECRGETIYFAVVDRFNEGKKDRGGKETELDDPTRTDWLKYWGGDLQGILDKVDYLKELGVTALWLTPLFEQVEGAAGGSAPIHGYWTRDFKRVNARWVNNPEEVRLFASDTVLDKLIDELHKRNMKFILDIVCNHSSPSDDGGQGQDLRRREARRRLRQRREPLVPPLRRREGLEQPVAGAKRGAMRPGDVQREQHRLPPLHHGRDQDVARQGCRCACASTR